MIFIYSTFPSKKEANAIGEGLLKKKLAGCFVIFPVESIYWWRKKIHKTQEVAVIIKTEKEKFKKIERFILANHSYDTPCIIEIPLGRITKKYLDWLSETSSCKNYLKKI